MNEYMNDIWKNEWKNEWTLNQGRRLNNYMNCRTSLIDSNQFGFEKR